MLCKLSRNKEMNKPTDNKVASKLSKVQDKLLEEVDLMLILSSNANNITNIKPLNKDLNSNNHQTSTEVATHVHQVEIKVEVSSLSKEVVSESEETEAFN